MEANSCTEPGFLYQGKCPEQTAQIGEDCFGFIEGGIVGHSDGFVFSLSLFLSFSLSLQAERMIPVRAGSVRQAASHCKMGPVITLFLDIKVITQRIVGYEAPRS